MSKTKKIKKRTLLGALIIGIIALGLLAIFAYTNISEKPSLEVAQESTITIPETTKTSDETISSNALLTGQFVDGDAVHSGTGDATVFDTPDGPILVFSDNFSVTNGPDLFVYLSPNAPKEPLGEFASLGKLKSNSGEQAYNLPGNYKDYKTIVIWCRAFTVTFATAELN